MPIGEDGIFVDEAGHRGSMSSDNDPVFSAVDRAVSLIQTWRAALSSGCPLALLVAFAGSFVPLPSADA